MSVQYLSANIHSFCTSGVFVYALGKYASQIRKLRMSRPKSDTKYLLKFDGVATFVHLRGATRETKL